MDGTDFKINIISTADNSGFKSAAGAATDLKQETVGAMEKTATATEGAAAASEKFEFHGEGMRRVIGQLNKIAPGMGEAFHGIESAVTKGGGALIVVSLAIEAAMTYWDMYKEKVAAGAEAQAAGLDKIRESTHAVLEEQEKFRNALENNKPAEADYLQNLAQQNELLQAQFTIKKNLLDIAEKADLANAKTPEEQQAIRARFEVGKGNLSQTEEARKIEAIANERIALENQKRQVQSEVDSTNAHLADLIRRSGKKNPLPFGAEPGEESEHLAGNITQADIAKASVEATRKIAEFTKTLEALNRQSAELRNRYSVESRVGGINADGRALANKLNERDKATGQTLAEMGSAAHLNQSQIIEIARRLINGQISHAQEIAGLKALMRNSGFGNK
ncbi:MAG: hypothetical protein WCS42_19165 [Verrucomicrobiota bacterium]